MGGQNHFTTTVSAPIPFSCNWGDSALGQLEYGLKRPENNPLLLQHSITDEYKLTSTNSTELMCDDRFKQLYVVPFIKNYANTIQSDQPIAFIDLDNDESEVFAVPT